LITASIDFHGGRLKKYHGLVYLEGTPQFDAATKKMTLANVDYAIDPKRHNPFVRTADRLAHDSVRKAIADSASWSIAGELERIRGEIDKAITRPWPGTSPSAARSIRSSRRTSSSAATGSSSAPSPRGARKLRRRRGRAALATPEVLS